MSSDWKLPAEIGVMALPEVTLFPGATLPLYIFEPRYRAMLAEALETHRVFAVALVKSPQDDSEVFDIGGAGVIRTCVTGVDGTSNLILEGLGRVRFVEWLEGEPHRRARIEPLQDQQSSEDGAQTLRKEIGKICHAWGEVDKGFSPYLKERLEKATNAGEFSDIVSATLVDDIRVRQRLLEELDVTKRLEILAEYLN